MKIKSIKQSNIYYDALIFLYDEAKKGMNGYPSDNIEFAFETLEKLVDLYFKQQQDVKRFMELKNNITNREEMDEFWEIDNKLSKVGNEE